MHFPKRDAGNLLGALGIEQGQNYTPKDLKTFPLDAQRGDICPSEQ